jgi:hypothetical protein
VISQRAFGAVESLVDAASLGELHLKGFNRPMAAFDILRLRDQPQGQNLSESNASESKA